MVEEDRELLSHTGRLVFRLAVSLAVLGLLHRPIHLALDMFWFPWEIQQRTGMIRQSNSYLTTQVAALRTFRADYETAATEGQRRAILEEMRVVADTIPGSVPPDIAAFLAAEGR